MGARDRVRSPAKSTTSTTHAPTNVEHNHKARVDLLRGALAEGFFFFSFSFLCVLLNSTTDCVDAKRGRKGWGCESVIDVHGMGFLGFGVNGEW